MNSVSLDITCYWLCHYLLQPGFSWDSVLGTALTQPRLEHAMKTSLKNGFSNLVDYSHFNYHERIRKVEYSLEPGGVHRACTLNSEQRLGECLSSLRELGAVGDPLLPTIRLLGGIIPSTNQQSRSVWVHKSRVHVPRLSAADTIPTDPTTGAVRLG